MHHFQIFKGSLNAFPMNLQPFISKSVLYSLESQEYSQLQGFKFYSRAKLEIRMMCRKCRLKENQKRPETEVPSGQKVRRWKFLKYKLNGDAEFVEFVNGRRILFSLFRFMEFLIVVLWTIYWPPQPNQHFGKWSSQKRPLLRQTKREAFVE